MIGNTIIDKCRVCERPCKTKNIMISSMCVDFKPDMKKLKKSEEKTRFLNATPNFKTCVSYWE